MRRNRSLKKARAPAKLEQPFESCPIIKEEEDFRKAPFAFSRLRDLTAFDARCLGLAAPLAGGPWRAILWPMRAKPAGLLLLAASLAASGLPAAAECVASDPNANVGVLVRQCQEEYNAILVELAAARDQEDAAAARRAAEHLTRWEQAYRQLEPQIRADNDRIRNAQWDTGTIDGTPTQRSGGSRIELIDTSKATSLRGELGQLLAAPAKTDNDMHFLPIQMPMPVPEKPEDRQRSGERAERGDERLRGLPQPDPAQSGQVANDYLRAGRPADAARVLDRLIENGTPNPDAYLLRGEARRLSGDWQGAFADAQKALALGAEHPYAGELLGASRMQLERLGLAPARAAAPKRPEFDRPAEAAAKDAGAFGPGATPAMLATPVTMPGRGEPLLAAAEGKLRMRDYKGALFDLSRLLSRNPRDVRTLAMRARALNWGRNPQAAFHDAEEALKLQPDDPEALRERGYALLQLGQPAEALRDLNRAIRLDPKSALGYLYRAMALDRLDQHEAALRDYRRAAELDPGLRSFYDEAAGGAGRPAAPAGHAPARLWFWGAAGLIALVFLAAGLLPAWRKSAGQTTARRETVPQEPGPAAAQTLVPGAVLAGTYRVGRVLGRGGMGVVYEAQDLVLDRRVAIKQLRTPEGAAEELDRLLREARVVAALRHPNLAQIHTVIEEGGRLYLVFEHVAGTPLDKLLEERGPLSPGALSALLGGVCAALDYAHGQRVIHRDLKPANVMLAEDGGARVMDFGIAHRARADSGQTQTAAWGTPPYMAPEQEAGTVSRESDLFALGVMAYELLTGDRPFSGRVYGEKLSGRFPAASQRAPGLPPGIDAFFSRALHPDPAQRFHTGAEFLSGYQAAAQGRPARA